MDKEQQYFPNGCTECGEKVTFSGDTFTYQCSGCGAFATAHRDNSLYAKKYEPYQYLASAEINELRKSLESVFNNLWSQRIDFKRELGHHAYPEAIINILWPKNVRLAVINDVDPEFVQVLKHNTKTGICDVFSFKHEQIVENVYFETLKPVSNKAKAYVWLALELGVKIPDCQIGFFSELQLKYAIEICSKSLSLARRKAIDSIKET